MNANLNLTHNVVSCHLAHRCVKIGGRFWGGFGNPFHNSLNVDCGWVARWSRRIPSDKPYTNWEVCIKLSLFWLKWKKFFYVSELIWDWDFKWRIYQHVIWPLCRWIKVVLISQRMWGCAKAKFGINFWCFIFFVLFIAYFTHELFVWIQLKTNTHTHIFLKKGDFQIAFGILTHYFMQPHIMYMLFPPFPTFSHSIIFYSFLFLIYGQLVHPWSLNGPWRASVHQQHFSPFLSMASTSFLLWPLLPYCLYKVGD